MYIIPHTIRRTGTSSALPVISRRRNRVARADGSRHDVSFFPRCASQRPSIRGREIAAADVQTAGRHRREYLPLAAIADREGGKMVVA